MADLRQLQKKLGHVFQDPALLERALTHSSYANENRRRGILDNERLEFLGDSILGMEVAAYLYGRYPDMREGEMTRLRAELVCEGSLAAVGEAIGLGEYLRLGKGEDAGGGRKRPSIVSDAFEAVLAACWLDGGPQVAHRIVHEMVIARIPEDLSHPDRDYKTELQELLQKNPDNHFRYEPAGESGPDHDKRFAVQLLVNGSVAGTGVGRSKKEAEQNAAHDALQSLKA